MAKYGTSGTSRRSGRSIYRSATTGAIVNSDAGQSRRSGQPRTSRASAKSEAERLAIVRDAKIMLTRLQQDRERLPKGL